MAGAMTVSLSLLDSLLVPGRVVIAGALGEADGICILNHRLTHLEQRREGCNYNMPEQSRAFEVARPLEYPDHKCQLFRETHISRKKLCLPGTYSPHAECASMHGAQ